MVLAGDRFVLATDGAYDGLRDTDLALAARLVPAAAVAELLSRTKAAQAARDLFADDAEPPASDNMTVVVLAVSDPPVAPASEPTPENHP